jgi:hypothetical protein
MWVKILNWNSYEMESEEEATPFVPASLYKKSPIHNYFVYSMVQKIRTAPTHIAGNYV